MAPPITPVELPPPPSPQPRKPRLPVSPTSRKPLYVSSPSARHVETGLSVCSVLLSICGCEICCLICSENANASTAAHSHYARPFASDDRPVPTAVPNRHTNACSNAQQQSTGHEQVAERRRTCTSIVFLSSGSHSSLHSLAAKAAAPWHSHSAIVSSQQGSCHCIQCTVEDRWRSPFNSGSRSINVNICVCAADRLYSSNCTHCWK